MAESTRRLHATERYAEKTELAIERMRDHFAVVTAAIAAARADLARQHREGLIADETLLNLESDLEVEETSVLLQLEEG